MKKNIRSLILVLIFLTSLFSFSIVLYFSSYKDVDNDIKFLLNDNAVNKIYKNGNVIRVLEGNTSNISFIILPTKNVDFNSYLLLAKGLNDYGYDAYITGYLMNRYYTNDPLNYILSLKSEDEVYYVISHGDIDNSCINYINEHKDIFKGIILLDGNDIKTQNNIKTLHICSDDFNNYLNKDNYIRINGGSFDGFANYENKN